MTRKVLAALLCALALPAGARADCRLHTGDRVVLYGTMDDPDVLLWDSRDRMRSYGNATFDDSQLLLEHAAVAPPGTRATVGGCIARDVTSKFSTNVDDAVSVTIQTGAMRGRAFWVLGSAIRGVYKPLVRRHGRGRVRR